MNLLSSFKQYFSTGARQLSDLLQPPIDKQQPKQPGALERFGIFNFAGNKNPMSNETLGSLSAVMRVQPAPPSDKTHEPFTVKLKKSPPDPAEAAEKIVKQIGFTAADIEAYKAKHKQDPRTDIANIVNRCMIDPRCPKENLEAIPKPDKNGVQPEYTLTVQNIPRSVTEPLRDFLKTERAAQQTEFDTKLQTLKNNSTGLIARDTAKQIGAAVKNNAPTLLATTAGGLGTAADLVLRQPLALPEVSEMVKNMRVVVGNAAAIAESAPPVAMVTAGIAGAVATTEQYLGGQVADKLGDIANQNRERVLAMPFPPLQITMDDAEPQLQPVPESKAKERPFAEPNVQPQVTDLPTTPSDLVPTGNRTPQTTQAEPQSKAQPNTTAPPTTQQQPTQPSAPQPKPPRISPDDILKATTAATVTAAASTAATEAIKNVGQPEAASETFVGMLRGQRVELDDVPMQTVQYTKRDRVQYEQLRKDFDRAGTGDRAKFLKSLASDPDKVAQLKSVGIKDAEILKMKDGLMPNKDWQVHHKLPIDDGGTNASSNLVLIKNDPAHQAITNHQRTETGTLEPGQTKTIKFPIPPGDIYAPKPSEDKR
jgi:hypothetical protein